MLSPGFEKHFFWLDIGMLFKAEQNCAVAIISLCSLGLFGVGKFAGWLANKFRAAVNQFVPQLNNNKLRATADQQ